MENLFKKKDTEAIKKVKVKLACSCYGHTCDCRCVATESTRYDTTSTPYGTTEAKMCAELYYYNEANYPIS